MNTRHPFLFIRLLGALILPVLLFSCTGHIGYGVMNWSVPDHHLSAGDIVPVFIESNIGKVYVIGAGKERVEVPLWQLTLYKSKAKAKKAAQSMTEYRYTYATVKLDGLPIRSDPENTARQVYRLKQNQTIKILKKGTGSPVLAGKDPLEGDWLEVMTDDGSTGWCFSYNLTVYDERESGATAVASSDSGPDDVLENLLSHTWYPDAYRTMIADNRIDIDRINPSWGFFPGKDSLVARVESADGVVSFPYTSIVRTAEGLYAFTGSTLTVQVRRSDSILVQFTDTAGMPQALYFASIGTTPEDLVATEKSRRVEILSRLRAAGPRFSSGSYGSLQFVSAETFLWSGYQLLSPSVIPAGSGSGGTLELRYFLPAEVSADYDGVLSFSFPQNASRASFLYKLTAKGLRLEYVSESNIKDSVVQSRNLNPVVVFFTPDQGGS